jgi:hypothetical protein
MAVDVTCARHDISAPIDLIPTQFVRLEWIGVDWSGLEWIGVDWSGLEWIGVDQSGSGSAADIGWQWSSWLQVILSQVLRQDTHESHL